jgi:hypothetical protein
MFISTIFRSPTIIFIAGLASVLFSGFVAITIFRKFSDKKAGLVINRQGIIDNSSGLSAGLVLWSDIDKIETIKVLSQKLMMVIVKNPQDYIDRAAMPLQRKGMEMNHRIYGSPISISANCLQTDFDNLHTLLIAKMKEYKL